MGRPRKVDWDHVRKLHMDGLTYRQIADRVGCSKNTVQTIIRPAYQRSQRDGAKRRLYAAACPDCGGPRNIYHERCFDCFNRHRTLSVRENELRCSVCGEWKPDEAFYKMAPSVQPDRLARRRRRHICRACDNQARSERRRRRAVA